MSPTPAAQLADPTHYPVALWQRPSWIPVAPGSPLRPRGVLRDPLAAANKFLTLPGGINY